MHRCRKLLTGGGQKSEVFSARGRTLIFYLYFYFIAYHHVPIYHTHLQTISIVVVLLGAANQE